MSKFQFPSNPQLNQEYTFNNKVWAWDGVSWVGARETATQEQKEIIWAKQSLLLPNRSRRLNSGYSGNTDQRRTKVGTIPVFKHYMERNLNTFSSTPSILPSDISSSNLLLWYSADQETGYVNGNAVSVMTNFGIGTDATPFTSGPTYSSNVLNNLPVYLFNNTPMKTTNSYILGDWTFFVVFNDTSNILGFERIIDHEYTQGFWLGRNSTTANSFGGGVKQNSPPYGIYITANDTEWNIIANQRDSTTHNIWNNGDWNSRVTQSVVSSSTTSNPIGIGGWATNGTQAATNMYMAEIIFYDIALTTSNREQIEGYLAHKWGLASNLPVGHPYKSSRP